MALTYSMNRIIPLTKTGTGISTLKEKISCLFIFKEYTKYKAHKALLQ
jgi:hypothetical protein